MSDQTQEMFRQKQRSALDRKKVPYIEEPRIGTGRTLRIGDVVGWENLLIPVIIFRHYSVMHVLLVAVGVIESS